MTPRPPQRLNARQQQVLGAIVDHYILRAEPVSSRILSQSAILKASSATIRNTMVELEDHGMVAQPHASAGRLPTDLGYRTYVDELMHPHELSEADRLAVEREAPAKISEEELFTRMAKHLAQSCHLMAIVLPPPSSKATFRQMSLVPLEEGRTVLILASSESDIRTTVIDSGLETSIFRLEAITRRINSQMAGRPVAELNGHLEKPLDRQISEDEARAMDLLSRSILKLTLPQSQEDIILAGAHFLLKQPDFGNIEDIREVIDLLDSKVTLVHFLRQKADREGVHVTVGEETLDGRPFRTLSLVSSAFGGQREGGVVGVMGPKRMPYAKVVPLVAHAAKTLSRRLSGDKNSEEEFPTR